MDAIIHGDIEIVKLLLEAGANVDIANEYGCTSLYYAVDNFNIVQLLLNHILYCD
jgi:ankyrin repeat protein